LYSLATRVPGGLGLALSVARLALRWAGGLPELVKSDLVTLSSRAWGHGLPTRSVGVMRNSSNQAESRMICAGRIALFANSEQALAGAPAAHQN
jgi:hypothetical protein